MFKYSIGIKTTLLEPLQSKKSIFKAIFRQNNYKDLVFARNEFLRIVGSPNQSLILIIMYYMIKLYFGKTSHKDLVFAQNGFLRLVGAPNESLILF